MAGAALSTPTNKEFHPCKLSGVLGQAEEPVQLCAWGQQLWAQSGSGIWGVWDVGVCALPSLSSIAESSANLPSASLRTGSCQ